MPLRYKIKLNTPNKNKLKNWVLHHFYLRCLNLTVVLGFLSYFNKIPKKYFVLLKIIPKLKHSYIFSIPKY